MKKTVKLIPIFLLFSSATFAQLGWINDSTFTPEQKRAVQELEKDKSWYPEGLKLYGHNLRFTANVNDISDLSLRRVVLLPTISIPAFIGGKLNDEDNRFTYQFNPLVGFGGSFRWERIRHDGQRVKVYKPISFQPMLLFYKNNVENNRFGGVYALTLTLADHFQVGYGYSDDKMPNYDSHHLFLVGVNLPLEGLFNSTDTSGD